MMKEHRNVKYKHKINKIFLITYSTKFPRKYITKYTNKGEGKNKTNAYTIYIYIVYALLYTIYAYKLKYSQTFSNTEAMVANLLHFE